MSVTLVKPASINTPFPHHARNYTAYEPDLPPPVYAPQEVAVGILHAAEHPKRDVYIGGAGRGLSIFNRLFPWLMDEVAKTLIPQTQRAEAPRRPEGALHQPGVDGQTDSDHPGMVMHTSFYTRASLHPAASLALLAAVGAGIAALAGHHEPRAERGWF